MSNREKQLIGLVIILLVLLAGYWLLYKPMQNERLELEDEIASLNEQVTVLREEYAKMPEYKEGIERSHKIIEEVVQKYPADLSQESAFELLFDMEGTIEDVEFTAVSFTPPEVLSYSNEGDQATSVKAIVQAVRTVQELEYETVKEALRYLYGYDDRTVLQGLTLALSEETGLVNMSMNMNMYALVGPGREYVVPTFEQVPTGNDAPFDTDLAAVATETRERESRVQDAVSDLFIALKPVASDIEAQVIGLTNDNIQKSYVKQDINGPVEAILRIYEQNGQYYANYDIDGVYKEAQAFNVETALELDLFAAKRLDEFDNVEMNLEIINQTSMTLYINRKEEDYSNPRLKINVTQGDAEFR